MLRGNIFNASQLAQGAEFHLQLFLPLQHLRPLGEELTVTIAHAHQTHLRPEVEQHPPSTIAALSSSAIPTCRLAMRRARPRDIGGNAEAAWGGRSMAYSSLESFSATRSRALRLRGLSWISSALGTNGLRVIRRSRGCRPQTH